MRRDSSSFGLAASLPIGNGDVLRPAERGSRWTAASDLVVEGQAGVSRLPFEAIGPFAEGIQASVRRRFEAQRYGGLFTSLLFRLRPSLVEDPRVDSALYPLPVRLLGNACGTPAARLFRGS